MGIIQPQREESLRRNAALLCAREKRHSPS